MLLVALAAGSLSSGWQTPAWLEVTGVGVSIVFLFGLAYVNVRAVLTAAPDAVVAPAGLKGRLLGRFVTVRRPWAVAAVGALFALSFDTVSQAALFALAAGRFGGVVHALLVAALFVLGMLVVDGINGVWISRLIRRADRTAVVASRVMACTVAGDQPRGGRVHGRQAAAARGRRLGRRARDADGRAGRDGGADRVRRRHARIAPARPGDGEVAAERGALPGVDGSDLPSAASVDASRRRRPAPAP